jgi:hypothetical protein
MEENQVLHMCDVCAKCPREIENKCDYPCTDAMEEFRAKNRHQENKPKESDISSQFNKVSYDNDISGFIEYDVSSLEYFQIMKGRKPFIDLISKSSLLDYMYEENEKYCKENGLCPECRIPLERYESKEEIWGSVQTAEVYWHCPRGC